jgi:hypothetical protein
VQRLWSGTGVIFGGARQIKQSGHGRDQGVAAQESDPGRRASQIEQGHQGGGVFLAALAADGIQAVRLEQLRAIARQLGIAAQGTASVGGITVEMKNQIGHGINALCR